MLTFLGGAKKNLGQRTPFTLSCRFHATFAFDFDFDFDFDKLLIKPMKRQVHIKYIFAVWNIIRGTYYQLDDSL
jgi:hypothetical protein